MAALGNLLEVSPRILTRLAYTAPEQYSVRSIPKRSGAPRTLHVPTPLLRFVQRRLLRRVFDPYLHGAEVAAYVRGRDMLDTVDKHTAPRVLIGLDLKDFFSDTRRWWIRDALVEQYEMPRPVADTISSLVTVPMGEPKRWRVPQGAPTSGSVTNLVAAQRLDPHFCDLAESHGLRYSRYADDVTLTSTAFLPKSTVDSVLKRAFQIVHDAGYRTNFEKVRVIGRGGSQHVLGCVVNAGRNVPRETYRELRSLVQHIVVDGFEAHAAVRGFENGERLRDHVEGRLGWLSQVAPARGAKLRAQLMSGTGV